MLVNLIVKRNSETGNYDLWEKQITFFPNHEDFFRSAGYIFSVLSFRTIEYAHFCAFHHTELTNKPERVDI